MSTDVIDRSTDDPLDSIDEDGRTRSELIVIRIADDTVESVFSIGKILYLEYSCAGSDSPRCAIAWSKIGSIPAEASCIPRINLEFHRTRIDTGSCVSVGELV